MGATIAEPVTHRQFLKMIGLAIAGAGAGQLIGQPKQAMAADETVTGNLYVTGSTGLGTTSPTERLHVDGNIKLGKSGTSESDYAAKPSYSLKMNGNYWNSALGNREIEAGAIYGIPTGSNVNPAPPTRVTLKAGGLDVLSLVSNGNVGIGTTWPSETVEVNGSIRIDGTIKVNGVEAIDANGIAKKAFYDT